MRRALLIVGLLCAASFLPQGQAQAEPPLSITRIEASERLIVGVSANSYVTVWNRDANPQSATVEWSYNDGTALNPQTPRQAYNQMTQVIEPMTNFTFTLPFTPDAAHKGNQTIVARLTGFNQQSYAGSNATRSHPVFVAAPKLNVTMDATPVEGVLDSGVGFFNFHVRNDGNAPDVPNVTISQDPNFNLTVLGNFSPIPPGHGATGQVLVRPLTTNGSINLTANLTVESGIHRVVNASAAAPPLHVNATLVARNQSVRVAPIPAVLQVRAANRTVSTTITNTGEEDDVYNVSAIVAPPSSGMNATLALGRGSANRTLPWYGNHTLGLHPGESVTLDLVLSYNASAGDGNATVTLSVTSANKALLAPRHPDKPLGASTSSRLAPAGPEPALVAIEGPSDAYPTDAHSFTFRVSNLGLDPSGPAIVRALVQDNLQVVARGNLTVPALAPGESHAAAWSVPFAELRGHYVVAATLEPHENDTDMDPTDNARTFPFYVRAPALRLDVPKEVSVTPGAALSIVGGPRSILLKNLGDKEESFHVTLASNAPWLAATWDVSVPSGVTVTLPLNLSVPARVGATSLAATVRAEILGHGAYRDERDIAVVVVPIDAPGIDLGPIPDGVARRPQTIEARITDSIGVEHAEVRIARPDGVTHVLFLVETSPGAWSASYAPAITGNHTIEVYAEGVGGAQRASRAAQPWIVKTAPYAGVVPIGFREGSVIGNTTLRFDDAAPGTTRVLVVDVGQGPQPVPYPYEVQAEFWKDGKHAIRLHATSVDGALWENTINVTLDRTPPALSDAAVKAQADGTLLLSVRTTPAARVVASISTPSGPITVPMTRSVGGQYVASALAPDEWTAVTFAATGENGVESTVAVTSGGGKAVPGAGWAAIIGGMAAAFVLGRRSEN